MLLIHSLGNVLWIVGVHNSTVQATILDPIMMVAITENMNAFAAGEPIPNILTYSFYVFCQMGGSGCCLPLIVDTFPFSKDKAKRPLPPSVALCNPWFVELVCEKARGLVLNPAALRLELARCGAHRCEPFGAITVC